MRLFNQARMGSSQILVAAAALGGLTIALQTPALGATWVGGTDNKWNTNANWTLPSSPPLNSSQTAIFNTASTFTTALVGTQVTVIGGIWFTGSAGNMLIASDPLGQNSGNVTFQTNGTTINGNANTGILIDNSSTGALTINPFEMKLGGSQAWTNNSTNKFTVNGPTSLNGSTLTVNGSGATDMNGSISNSTGTGSLIKDGGGTLTLSSSTLIYNGNTTVSNGTLLVNGTLSFSDALVTANGGTLGGTGSIGRATTINSGATLNPGTTAATAATLTVVRNLTLGGTAAFDLPTSTSNDKINMNAANASGYTLAFGGTLQVNAPGVHLTNGQTFDLFDWGARTTISGTFSTINLPTLDSGLAWKVYTGGQTFDYATGQISVVPEPLSMTSLGLAGFASLMARHRRRQSV